MSAVRFLTGITTSGTPHLGNYVGSIRPAVAASLRPGVESYYFSPESKRMAERMVRVLSATTGAENRNARIARFRVLRTAQNPAVLMECGYITTTREAALIVQPAYREKIAEGLARGIIEQRGGPLLSESKL